MSLKSFRFVFLIALMVPVMFLLVEGVPESALADITCENSDYNCIYVVDGGNRIVCTRSFCGGNPSQYEISTGKKAVLEDLYAFDGVNPNNPTTTLAPQLLTISVNGSLVSATGSGTCSYSGGTYLDPGFTSPWNTTSNASVSCNWSGSFVSSNLVPGNTYYVRIVFSDVSGSVTGTSNFIAPAAETTTTLRAITTTTVFGSPVNPCLDPANPEYACGWAVLSADNQVGNIIVCTYAVCGSGSFGGMRLVLQTQQMEGGNVAGWNGGTYDEATGTFILPGGGTLKSGDKIEEAIFPKIENPDVIEAIAAPSGKVYETTEEYANAETQSVITSAIISIDLPVFQVRELTYQVSFDPAGSAPEFLLKSGKILNENVSNVATTQKVDSLATTTSLVRNSTKIVLNRAQLNGKNGNLKVKLLTAKKIYAEVGIKVVQPKRYSSCKALVKDYPGGVIAAAKWSDKTSLKQKFDYVAKPTLNVRVFSLNKRFDFDKDQIVCEKNNK
jgi:hypothetical protein